MKAAMPFLRKKRGRHQKSKFRWLEDEKMRKKQNTFGHRWKTRKSVNTAFLRV